MKSPKVDTSGTEAAQRAVAEAQAASNNLAKNFRTDLSSENLTKVVPGGSADAAAPGLATRKRRTGDTMASQLGVNV